MKLLPVLMLLMFNSAVFAQTNRLINGIILDSTTNEPIPFANIFTDLRTESTSDFDGKFRIQISNASVLHVSFVGYRNAKINLSGIKDSNLIIKLSPIPFNPGNYFKIEYLPIDTLFYKNGQIKLINYPHGSSVSFYPNGEKRKVEFNGHVRIWYENGNLKYQSITLGQHDILKTEWYETGQKKSEGHLFWGYREGINHGDWIKSDNWTYWDKMGNKLKKKK